MGQSHEDLTGPEKVRKACAELAGWGWCDEHKSSRWGGSEPCDDLHPQPRVHGWQDPEAPAGEGFD